MAYKYEAVATDLQHRMTWNEWAVGDQLPGIHELAAHYAVSPSVVKDAQEVLRKEGFIETRQGRGSFVVSIPEPGDMTLGIRRHLEAIRADLAEARDAVVRAERRLAELSETVV
ncbi:MULTISPECIES: winged helix-turn-helix domain-containing protein [unclassified Rhodococcus (in: high G+C Gram-positive bacteria)]|jgi:DNA-binding GntR family transcriptional regulator|uniref:winged helix-turn-helix domain-containing protein n=1 Tax=unclassified Rhodococcus (in: high G+C Gram-positive bacteria) TaxID=192944 RepID=UPI00146D9D3C|nr:MULTISPECIES: winged helix-turn-helix domain-containing protein [unclassified Rhodococcus (in: high G+C Gram-positive bacteria)]MBF0659941.1 winged helix-turn-helix transcriptional regulator [Rhodococcus sp. (in: high G+C Gram-positive bacteria)]NME80285.1 winged helix-turn-helix transcriptional regulator [Rhodococcus sp. 105337]